jgi:hypothetical protein
MKNLSRQSVSVTLFVCLLLLVFSCRGQKAEDQREAAKIIFIKGKANVNGRVLKQGDNFPTDEEVQLEKDSTVDVRFKNGSIVRLKESKVKLKLEDNSIEWFLSSGIIYSSVAKKSKTEKYSILTPTSVMGVRGTRFFAQESDGKSYICVCDGKVAARLLDGTNEKIVSEGEDLYLEKGKPVNDPVPSPDMKKMADEVFQEMGVKI